MIEITQEALESFKKAIKEKEGKGISFVLAVYQTLDEFSAREAKEKGIKLACKKGCSLCCHQLVTCTEIEFNEILKYIQSLWRETRRPLELKLRKRAKEWFKYYQRKKLILDLNPLIQTQEWFGKPCVFLDKKTGSCQIYPVRIIDCRTITSLTPCTPGKQEAKRFRFPAEVIANNMILEKQGEISERNNEPFGVTPILHWLCAKGFLK